MRIVLMGDARVNRRSALCGEPKRVQDAEAFTYLPWAEFMQSSPFADTKTSSMVGTEDNEGIGVHCDNGFEQTFEMSIHALQLVDEVAVSASVVVSAEQVALGIVQVRPVRRSNMGIEEERFG